MPTMAQQCADSLKQVVAFYADHGCPCAFPRFGQLTQFHFTHYGSGAVGCHATEIAIHLVTMDSGPYQHVGGPTDGPEPLACKICGTELECRWDQYSINMDVTTLVYRIVRAQPKGPSPTGPIPMPRGFYGFADASIKMCADAFITEGSFEDMIAYLTALREP